MEQHQYQSVAQAGERLLFLLSLFKNLSSYHDQAEYVVGADYAVPNCQDHYFLHFRCTYAATAAL